VFLWAVAVVSLGFAGYHYPSHPHISRRAWTVLKRRSADPTAVQDRLARLIVTYGRRHPDATPEQLASSLLKMFGAEANDGRESGPVSD
jgi:hypothetical protein